MTYQTPTENFSNSRGNSRVEPFSPNKSIKPMESRYLGGQYHHTETLWRVLIDFICLSILLIASLVSHYIAIPFTRGFFCSDTSIKYPYKDNTIPTYAAVILSVGVPIVWMWVTEFCKLCYYMKHVKPKFLVKLELCGGKSKSLHPFIRNLYILTVVFGYGYLATWVLLEVTKNFVGELRPHFLAVCQSTLNCSSLSSSMNAYFSYQQYGVDFTCASSDTDSVREARRSFFSGHTAPLFFGFGFLIMYIHVSWAWRHLGILGHLFQVGLLVLASYVGYTRITDFHHHWHDVFAGAVVGSLIAFVTFKFILDWRRYNPHFLPYTVSQNQIQSGIVLNGNISESASHGGDQRVWHHELL